MIEHDEHTRKATKAMHRLSEYDWNLALSLFPRVCNDTGEVIPMFSYAYRGTRIISGPGEDLLVVRWLLSDTYLLERIKGTIK